MHRLGLVVLLLLPTFGLAQKKSNQPQLDQEISKMMLEVSPDSIKHYIYKMVSFGTRHSLSDTVSDTNGIGAARRWVAGKFREFAHLSRQLMTVELDPYEVAPGRRIPYPVVMKNVVATLKGTDPSDDRVLLVSGHLDSRASNVMDSLSKAPGANDDASGVAVVMELARVMSRRSFPCTITFIAVQGEEQGLLGSSYMAEKAHNQGVNIIAMLNNDIVGNTLASETGAKNDHTVRIFSEMIPEAETDADVRARNSLKSENDSPSRQLARYIKEVSDPYFRGKFTATLNMRPDRFLRGGDHTPFSRKGFTAVRFCEFHENFTQQHQDLRTENGIAYGDIPEHVDFVYAANVARMNLITLASLAKAPPAPLSPQMKINLGNKTLLNWELPTNGPKIKGFNILIRETYQPFWETKVFVTGTSTELPYSKDNYFFGIQAVGVDGHLSQIVIPVPTRD